MNELTQVVTMAEAVSIWGKSRGSIRHHIASGNLESRQTEQKITLISVRSLIRVFGYPENKGVWDA